jgi:hypothetical protein
MSLFESIPQLDLSSRFDRPALSAARVGDYFALLRDIFFFPQRLRDSVQKVAREQHHEEAPPGDWHYDSWSGWFARNPIQASLIRLTALLTLIVLAGEVLLFGVLFALQPGQSLPLTSMVLSLLIGLLASGALLVLALYNDQIDMLTPICLPAGMALTLWLIAMLAPLTEDWLIGRGMALLLCAICGLGFGVMFGIGFALAGSGLSGRSAQVAFGAAIGALIGLSVFYVNSQSTSADQQLLLQWAGIALLGALAAMLGFLVGVYRPDDWLVATIRMGNFRDPNAWQRIAHITPLPFSQLSLHLKSWLEFDWARGVENAAILWRYTGQQDQIRRALHEILAETKDDKLLEMVTRIADGSHRFPFDMISYTDPLRVKMKSTGSLSPTDTPKQPTSEQRKRTRQRMRGRSAGRLSLTPDLPLDTPSKATVAGFWYLAHGYSADALTAFKKAPASPLGKEMCAIAETLAMLQREENLLATSSLKLPTQPTDAKRKPTWQMLDQLQAMIHSARLQRSSSTPEKRALASEITRRQMAEIVHVQTLPHVEMRQIQELANSWQGDLERWLAAPDVQKVKAIKNPFMFAEPLRDKQSLFVNRKAELAALKEAWTVGNLQTVFIYGQPLVGKTSLLHQAELTLSGSVQLAWFRLGHLMSDHAPLRQVLTAICTAVLNASVFEMTMFDGDGLRSLVAEIETSRDPYAVCERTIRTTCRQIGARNLVLVLDDYDALEPAFESSDDHDHFLGFLWHLYQGIKNFNVAFVSQRSPILYFRARTTNPFANTARTLVVRNLSKDDCTALLRRPAEGFSLYFTDAAVNEIFSLSGGHPYLVQLIGYAIVQRFNELAEGGKGEPLIDAQDIEEAILRPEFSGLCHHYYHQMERLIERAGYESSMLLGAIAHEVDGEREDQLAEELTPQPIQDADEMQTLLRRLAEYGVIKYSAADQRWRICSELWRKWLTVSHRLLVAPEEYIT